jgi:ABC-type nitrate/sulfonate/bicarbonate transport system ATPase subunit
MTGSASGVRREDFISIRNLRKAYKERRHVKRDPEDPAPRFGEEIPVLESINLGAERGEIICFLGPSGCGKTTLLRILAGFDRNYAGTVEVDGEKVTGPSPNHIFVFQQSGLLDWMTVEENVGLGIRNMKDKIAMRGKITEYLELVDLAGFEDRYPFELSGGMQRRAELARAMAVNPDLLFMDEPFTGLDFFTHMRMREEVLNLHAYLKITMVIVIHDIEDALIMGDRIVVFGDRPTRVKMEKKLNFARPRDFSSDQGLAELRRQIYLMMGVHYAL